MDNILFNDFQAREYPLTFNQKNFYFIQSRQPFSKAFNLPYAFRLNISISVTHLEQAINQVIKNHNILKAKFYKKNTNEIVQTIANNLNLKIDLIKSNNISYEIIKDYYRKPFNLQIPPLFRVGLFCNNTSKESILVVVFHHIIMDAIGTQKFLKEVFDYYEGIKIFNYDNIQQKQYDNFKQFELSNDEYSNLALYWKEKLSCYSALSLPYSKVVMDLNSDIKNYFCVPLNIEILSQIKAILKETHVSIFTFFLSALQILLSQYTNNSDIAIATAIDRRYTNNSKYDLGDFTNLIVIRQNLNLHQSFYELLQITHETFMEGLINSGFDLISLVKELDDSTDLLSTIRQVGLVYHNFKKLPNGLEFIPEIAQESDNDINIEIIEIDNQCNIIFKYNANVLSEKIIKKFSEYYILLLKEILYNPEQKLSQINFLTEQDKKFLNKISLLNISQNYEFLPVHQLFEQQALSYPANIAILSPNDNISYDLLNKKANQLARFIQQQHLEILGCNIKEGDIVPIFIDKGINFVISTLAIFKLGAAYVPLDTQYPSERVRYILNEIKPKIVLTESKDISIHFKEGLCIIDINHRDIVQKLDDNLNIAIEQASLAYVIFTSGSTGKPKGVMVKHGGISYLIYFQSLKFEIDHTSIILQFAPTSFDASISEIWTSLTNAAILFVPSKSQHLFGQELSEIIKYNKVTVVTLPPSILATLPVEEQLNLKTLIVAGEACSENIIEPWLRKVPLVINAYGPSEVTVCATMNKITDSKLIRNIGLPLEHVKLYILNEYLQPVVENIPGELYIGGYGLAKGYINNEELNKKSFINYKGEIIYKSGDIVKYSSSDESLIYVGRNDSQIKLRGQRIELLEIEEVLRNFSDIQECIITINKVNSYDSIIAYIVPKTNLMNLEEVKLYIKQYLPSYMYPNYYIILSKLPLNSNGKVNTQCLPLPKTIDDKTNVLENTNTFTDNLIQIWSELLNIPKDDIKLEDSFFDLGGHSLLVIELISRIKDVVGIEVSIKTIFEFPKLKDFIIIVEPNGKIVELPVSELQNDLLADIAHYTTHIDECRNYIKISQQKILLTGVTGFLGRFILLELLNSTQAIIYCLIRKNNDNLSSTKRLNNILIEIGCLEHVNNPRIIHIEGNLNKNNLDLSENTINELCNSIDSIVHCGAYVNHLHNYNTLRIANVVSTMNLLKIATMGKIKPFHYISTIDVVTEFTDKNENLSDFAIPTEMRPYSGGYVQSKWVCEKILWEYIQKKYPIYIYRPGNITGHSQSGFCIPHNNHALSLLKWFIQSRIIPNWDTKPFEMTPVDLVSKVIVTLANNSLNDGRQIFNIHNLNNISWRTYMEKVSEKMNLSLKIISNKEWCENILPTLTKDNALYPLKDLYKREEEYETTNQSLANYLSQVLPADLAMLYPSQENYDELIELYLNYLRKIKFI